MSNILENIPQRLHDEFRKGKISREKLEKLTDSYKKANQEEAVQAAIRDYYNPNYQGLNTAIKRREGTHEDFGGAVGGFDTSTGAISQQHNPVAGQPSHAVINSKSSKGKQKKAMRNYKYSKLRGKKVDNINEETNMKEIVKVLLQEGIDEETIHEVLDTIEENCEVSEGIIGNAIGKVKGFIEKEQKFRKLAKVAPTTEVGKRINNNKAIIKQNGEKVKSLAKTAKRLKKKGYMNGYNMVINAGKKAYKEAMGAMKDVGKDEDALINMGTSNRLSFKDAKRFRDSFTNKDNKNVVKTTYRRIK